MQPKLSILIAEDDKDDAFFIHSTFRESGLFERIELVSNGEELMKHLNNEQLILPDIILTDLNMPKMTGYEALENIRLSTRLQCIPIVVFSTSDNPGIINRCIKLGACSFLIKPFELKEYENIPAKIIEVCRNARKEEPHRS